MRDRRHITRTGRPVQRKAARGRARAGCLGVFPLAQRRFARACAQMSAALTGGFAGRAEADTLTEPTQPFRPFWLLFWPQNLTGQLCTAPCQLPAFGFATASVSCCHQAEQPKRRLHGETAGGARHAAVSPWAKRRRLRWINGRSVAHRNNLRGTYLDASRCLSKVRPNLAARRKGVFRCANPFWPLSLQAPRCLLPVAIPPASRRFMALAPVPQVRRCSTAALSPVQPWARPVTSSTVRKTRAAAKPASGVRPGRAALTFRFGADAPPPRDIPVRGGFSCARQTHQHGPQGTAHV